MSRMWSSILEAQKNSELKGISSSIKKEREKEEHSYYQTREISCLFVLRFIVHCISVNPS